MHKIFLFVSKFRTFNTRFPLCISKFNNKKSLHQSQTSLLRTFEARHWIFIRKLINSHTTIILFYLYSKTINRKYLNFHQMFILTFSIHGKMVEFSKYFDTF